MVRVFNPIIGIRDRDSIINCYMGNSYYCWSNELLTYYIQKLIIWSRWAQWTLVYNEIYCEHKLCFFSELSYFFNPINRETDINVLGFKSRLFETGWNGMACLPDWLVSTTRFESFSELNPSHTMACPGTKTGLHMTFSFIGLKKSILIYWVTKQQMADSIVLKILY